MSTNELPPAASKPALVIIGRFQPPSRGHYTVFSEGKKFIRNNKALGLEARPIVVIIGGSSTDSDKKKNPLTIAERELFMKASGKANGIIFLTATNAFNAFKVVREAGYEPVAIAAGSDRLSSYKKMLDTYFTKPDGKQIKHYTLSLSRDADAVETKKDKKQVNLDSALDSIKGGSVLQTDKISGSLARRAVELGYEDEFAKIAGLEDKPELAKKMFNKIKSAMSA